VLSRIFERKRERDKVAGGWRKLRMGSFMICIFLPNITFRLTNEVKDKMDGICSTRVEKEKFVQNVSGKSCNHMMF
jgi:hypothetical protein